MEAGRKDPLAEPSGFMMPMENCPPPCLVKAM